ncbi:MAG: hypothetical protein AB4290_14345 [Spirulina sp.]
MTAALKILEKITTGYTIFEKDQVLTEKQLNGITNYLNDETRLTRVNVLGVGIISGLRVSVQSDVVTVTKGVGITTDGDLLYYGNDTSFDRFLEYNKSYPKYAPLYLGGDTSGDMIPVYELIRQEVTDDPRSPIFSLPDFTAQTGKELQEMVAVLLMESYVNDPDLCTGTDCDNLGQDCINTLKLLLVDKTSLNLLKPAIATPDEAFSQLNEIVADRPLISQSINSLSELADVYRTVCTTIHDRLLVELPKVYLYCQTFLADVFPFDPTDDWRTRLIEIQNVASSDLGIQYYYDFLKDMVETYNQFRDLLFGDRTWCCPEIDRFPKHLLLGTLDPDSDPDENRTAFYPSPAMSQTTESRNHAKFLARKLDVLMQTFQVPAISDDAPIRITPSLLEDRPLEERAIPYYYQASETNPIHKSWNYSLSQRQMDTRNYSYHAATYGATGAAANPLTSQIGRFSFFRIEGYLGQSLETVVSAIYNAIYSSNLPFSVIFAQLGGQPSPPGEADENGRIPFNNLISQHSSLEHFGGVARGGTFVVLADTNDETVIADFVVPYYIAPPHPIIAADGLNSQRTQLIQIGYLAVFGSSSGHNPRQASQCLRDLGYYLNIIIESCRQHNTQDLEEFIANVKEMNKALGYPNSWFVTFYQAVKSNHELVGEAAKIANYYLDRAIAALASYNIDAADGLESKFIQLVNIGYLAIFGSSPGHDPRQVSNWLRDLGSYLNIIIESCRQDSTQDLDEFIANVKVANPASGYSNSWFIDFYLAVKSNHGLIGEAAKIANFYLDHAIAALSSDNIKAADGLKSNLDRLVASAERVAFGPSPKPDPDRLRNLSYYLNIIIESCRREDSLDSERLRASIQDISKELGYSNPEIRTFYEAVKNNHGLAGEAATVANSYLDCAIAALS